MEKKENVEEGVSEKPEEKKSAAYYEKRPEFGNRGPSKILLHFRKGLTFFLVIAACVIFYFLLLRIDDISVGVSKVIDVLKPILYGMVIAYLLNPIVKQIDWWLIPQLKKKMSQEKAKKVSRSVGVFAALVMLLALILALCNMLIPELYKSIRDMVQTLPGQISDMVTKIISIQKDTSPAGVMARNLLEKGSDALQNWIKQDLLTKVNEVMSNLTVGIINFVSEILNFLIGLIVSVYILFSKETFSAQSKKIVYAVFRTDHANMILHLTKKSNEIFGGFIIGKIIDSMIIGVLCFFGLTLLKMPYILLISGQESDRALVALLARYHRRAWPAMKHRRFAALCREDRRALAGAASLLRMADALDYRHKGAVEEVRVSLRRHAVRMVCFGGESCGRECRRALKKGDLFEELYGGRLDVVPGKEGDRDAR